MPGRKYPGRAIDPYPYETVVLQPSCFLKTNIRFAELEETIGRTRTCVANVEKTVAIVGWQRDAMGMLECSHLVLEQAWIHRETVIFRSEHERRDASLLQ
jgi:hypothetical protein